MFDLKWFMYLKKWLTLFFLSLIILVGLTSTEVFSQTFNASPLNELCRQVNPASDPGPIAYYAPGGSPMTTSDGRDDGPAASEAVYLTTYPPEQSADGRFTRVWFDSLEPNFKLGWVATKLRNGDDMLKAGSNIWRANNCSD